VTTLSEMNGNMNTLIEHKNVISIAAQVIAGALEAGAEVKGDEENKQEIQMQNLEGIINSEGGAEKPYTTEGD
jgi:V-type ATPase 116kDa subunit family